MLQLQAEILQWLKCFWSFVFISIVALKRGYGCVCGKFERRLSQILPVDNEGFNRKGEGETADE